MGETKDKPLDVRLIRLGGRYERARLSSDWDAAIRYERQFDELAREHPTVWIQPFVVRGQNVVRKARGLELLHV